MIAGSKLLELVVRVHGYDETIKGQAATGKWQKKNDLIAGGSGQGLRKRKGTRCGNNFHAGGVRVAHNAGHDQKEKAIRHRHW